MGALLCCGAMHIESSIQLGDQLPFDAIAAEFSPDAFRAKGFDSGSEVERYLFEDAHVSLYALADAVLDGGSNSGGKFLKLDASVWKSCEDMLVIDSLLQRFGLKYELIQGRELTIPYEFSSLSKSLVHMAFLFRWDSAYISEDNDLSILISHDGYFDVVSKNPVKLGKFTIKKI